MTKLKKLSREEILHLAKLAKLSLSEEEIIKFKKQLTETLDYINNLSELKTENVKPTNQSLKLTNATFKDGQENARGLDAEELLKSATNKKNNYFRIKKIL